MKIYLEQQKKSKIFKVKTYKFLTSILFNSCKYEKSKLQRF